MALTESLRMGEGLGYALPDSMLHAQFLLL